jgi:erythromycin esterase-like protein
LIIRTNYFLRILALLFLFKVLPLFSQAPAAEITELKRSIVRIDTISWGKSLKASPDLYNRVKSWSVIGLGEQTHGTHQFYRNKEHLIRFLAGEQGFCSIGLEAPMAEVALLNEYVQTGKGDVKEILKAFRQFTFETHEFVDLVNWVQAYNTGKQDKIEFFGFDFQSPFASLDYFRQHAKGIKQVELLSDSLSAGFYQLSDALYSHQVDPESFREVVGLSGQLISQLESSGRRDNRLNGYIENYRQFLLLNNPVQGYDMAKLSQVRDSLMAVNVLSHLKNNPKQKIILWAHNAHLQKTANAFSASMGQYLHKALKAKYGAVGQTTSRGFYTAYSPQVGKVTDQNPIQTPAPGQMEYYLQAVGVPVFMLDLSRIRNQKLREINSYKLLVYGATDKQVVPGRLTDDFDFVIHTDATTGARNFYLK